MPPRAKAFSCHITELGFAKGVYAVRVEHSSAEETDLPLWSEGP